MGMNGGKNPSKETVMAIDQELLDLLVCPQCKGNIPLNPNRDGLICETCRLVYAIEDDIPIMLVEEAKPLAEEGR